MTISAVFSKPSERKPGEWMICVNKLGVYFHFSCPCGCGAPGTIPLKLDEADKQTGEWVWDGDVTKPTLKPSIRKTTGCKWHGFFTDGNWNSCPDGAGNAKNVERM